MRTIFGLFADFAQAEKAVRELVIQGFDREEMNALLSKSTARNFMDVDQERIKAEKSTILPDTGHGSLFDRMLGGEKGVRTRDLGEVIAVGQLGNILSSTAATEDASGGGVKAALENFSVSPDAAEAYREGIRGGGILFFIRTSDERAGQAAQILTEHKGQRVANYI